MRKNVGILVRNYGRPNDQNQMIMEKNGTE